MRFKTAVKQAKGYRYIQRMKGSTIFDVIKYQPNNLDEEDVWADDWAVCDQGRLSYPVGSV